MAKLIKTTFEEEQKAKQEWFLTLTGLERWAYMLRIREMMKDPNIDYSIKEKKVTVTRRSQ
jgi:hypothetical protein